MNLNKLLDKLLKEGKIKRHWNVVKKYLKKQNKQLELFNF